MSSGPMKDRIAAVIEAQDADWFSQGKRFFRQQYFRADPVAISDGSDRHDPKREGVPRPSRCAGGTRRRSSHRPRASSPSSATSRSKTREPRPKRLLGSARLANPTPAPVAPLRKRNETSNASATGIASVNVERVEVQQTEQPLAACSSASGSNSTVADETRSRSMSPTACAADTDIRAVTFSTTLRGLGLVYQIDAQDSPGLNARLPGMFAVVCGVATR